MIAPCEDLMLIVCAPAMAVATVHHHLETRSFPISNSMLLWTAPTPLDGKYVALLTESVFFIDGTMRRLDADCVRVCTGHGC